MAILITGKFTPSAGAAAFKLYDATDLEYAITSTATGYTVDASDNVVLCDGTFTIDLYTAVGKGGNLLYIKNIGSGVVTVDGDTSETIDGETTQAVRPNDCMAIISDNANWVIV